MHFTREINWHFVIQFRKMLASGIGVFNLLKNTTHTTIKTCSSLFSTMYQSNPQLLNTMPYKLKALNLSSTILKQNQQLAFTPQIEQHRYGFGYKGRMMLKDIKRREMLRKFAPERIRLQTLRSNWILPKVVKVKRFFILFASTYI